MEDHPAVLSVSLLGRFTLEREGPDGRSHVIEDFAAELRRGHSATLFKLLLSHPERRVRRDQLIEIIWPGHSYASIGGSLDVAKSVLNRKLEELCGRSLLPRVSGDPPTYTTTPQSVLWTDLQAYEQARSQALSTKDQACSFAHWETAYSFLQRGDLLADDTAAYWYSSRLIQDRLARLSKQRTQCVLRIADLAIECGDTNRALSVLSAENETDPASEDIAFHLMNVLAHLSRPSQALACYAQLEAILLERGAMPREETKRLALWLRMAGPTKQFSGWFPEEMGLPEPFRPEKLHPVLTLPDPSSKGAPVPQEWQEAQREPLDSRSTGESAQFSPLFASPVNGTAPLSIDEHIQDWNTWFASGTLSPDGRMSDTTCTHHITDSRKSLMQTRRRTLYNLLMIGSTALVLSLDVVLFPDSNEYYNQTVLEELERITASYWRLRANTSLDVLENIADHFRTIVNLLQRSYPHRTAQRLYSLLGETAQLLGQTLFDLHEYTLAWYYYIFSLKAVQTASNHDLWAVGRGRMILLLIYWKMPKIAQPLLQEVRQLTIQSRRIACWLFAVEAEVCAHLDDPAGCDSALKAAQKLLESEPLDEDRYATGFNPSRLAGYEGACFVQLRQPERALPALKRALALLDSQALRRQSTLFTDLGIAHAQQGNIKEACTFASQALAITTRTKSRAVLERVRTLCWELEPWKETEAVKDLAQQLDRTVALITT